MNFTEFRKLTKKESKEYYKNYGNCWSFHREIILKMKLERPNEEIQLHHIQCEYNDKNYELWNPKYVVPIYKDDHNKLHNESEITRQNKSKGMIRFCKENPTFRRDIMTNEIKEKISLTKQRQNIRTKGTTGMKWWTNGLHNVLCAECPTNYYKGRII